MSEHAIRLTRRRVMLRPEMLWSLTLGLLRLNGRGVLVGIGVCLVVAVAACATQTESPQASRPPSLAQPAPVVSAPAPPETKASKTVKASYQGSDAAGHPTASGEPYNPNGSTAASRTLPIGSTVKVTNPATGKSVKVTINDRGPFVHGRSLDLSKRAAEKIGITHKGVAKLKVTPVKSSSASSESEAPVPAATPAAGTN